MKMGPLHKKMLRGSISSSTSCTKKAAEGFSPSRRVFVKAAGGPAESQRVRVQEENKRREAGRAPLMAAGSLREEQGPGSLDPPRSQRKQPSWPRSKVTLVRSQPRGGEWVVPP